MIPFDVPLGTPGRCQAFDIVPTDDDAQYRQCDSMGILIRESDPLGHMRVRFVCHEHRCSEESQLNPSVQPKPERFMLT